MSLEELLNRDKRFPQTLETGKQVLVILVILVIR